jgi:DNA-binding transcriptional regulator YiaG
MPNVASVLKEEIRRLARKEAKLQVTPLKKALAAERKTVAALRKQVASLARSKATPARAATGVKVVEADTSKAVSGWRKDTVRSTRRQLDLTQAQLAKLLGVSQISISFWETGRSTPRAKAQAKVMEARKLSKAQAHARLGADGGKRKPGPKPGKKAGRKKAARRKAGGRKAGRARAKKA